LNDLKQIEAYIAFDNPTGAVHLIDLLEATCDLLAAFPYAGRSRDEISSGVRSFAVGSNIIFYRATTKPIVIARILHGSRDLGAAFGAR
jgi:toxin ParE1/3/4